MCLPTALQVLVPGAQLCLASEVGVGDLSSGQHACRAGTLPTKPAVPNLWVTTPRGLISDILPIGYLRYDSLR